MSVVCAVPEGASPPPEPPPRDYSRIEVDVPFVDDVRDEKIRARLEACKQGMMQLDALRSKHHRLMQDMRGRLPPIPGCATVQARIKRCNETKNDRCSFQSVDSGISSAQNSVSRSSSPSISHRSSVSCDSGCSGYSSDMPTNQVPMPYSTYRKLSVEDRGLHNIASSPRDSFCSPMENQRNSRMPIVATTIACTTHIPSHGVERHWRKKNVVRPRSMYDRIGNEYDDQEPALFDHVAFNKLTPPSAHRKIGVVNAPATQDLQNAVKNTTTIRSPITKMRFPVNSSPQPQRPLRTAQKPPESVLKAKAVRVESQDSVFHASCIFVGKTPPSGRRIPQVTRRIRPQSMFESHDDEPLYATPARVLMRDRAEPSFAHTAAPRRSAFAPVVSRIINTLSKDDGSEKHHRPGLLAKKNWRESEGL